MSIQIPKPNITASDDRQRLRQIQSYLYKMAQQLQWAFDTIDTGGSTTGTPVSRNTVGSKSEGSKTPAENFAAIKSLIIKSADIVNAYYDTISARLEGTYVAQSDFGDFVEQTELTLEATAKGITQNYTDLQKVRADMSYLETTVDTVHGEVSRLDESVSEAQKNVDAVMDDVKNLEMTVLDTTAYIKSGLLGEDSNGIPVYGLEIGQTSSAGGQTVFDKFARFTADRLSFFDRNDVEVAYISDYHLYITNASITGSLVLMQQFEVSRGNQSVDFKWIGG